MRWLVRQNSWCVNFGSMNDGFFGVQLRRSSFKMTKRMSSYDLRNFQSNRSRWVWRWRDKVCKTRWLVRQNNWCVNFESTKDSLSGVQSRRSSSKMTRRMSSYDSRSFQSNRSRWVWRWRDKVRKTRWLVRRNNGASLSGAQKTVSPASNRVDLRPR